MSRGFRSSVLIAQITEQIGERFDSPGSDTNGQLPVLNTDQVQTQPHPESEKSKGLFVILVMGVLCEQDPRSCF